MNKHVIISPEGEKWLDQGQMWMYRNNLVEIEEPAKTGDIVDVVTVENRYLGTGFLNKESHVTVRLYSKDREETFDKAFFKKRIQFAYDFRKTVESKNLSNCRLVFGEADDLPGLTVDRYNDILVTQITSYGLEERKDLIYSSLLEVMKEDGEKITAIYERNDVKAREKEGLSLYKGF